MHSNRKTVGDEYNEYVNIRPIVFGLVLTLYLTAIQPVLGVSPSGLGFGKCHSAGAPLNRSGLVNWFYTGGHTESWLDVEPTQGTFTFSRWDTMLDGLFRQYPDSSFWLNVQTSQPDSVPQWAKGDPSLGYIGISSSASAFPIWNQSFQRAFETLMTKYSDHIYSPSFAHRDRIKAVVIMGGGGYGEMISYGGCPSGDRCQKFEAQGYTDEKYYDAVVNWLVPLYARLFPDYPLVLQLGGGLGQPTYSGNVGKQAARALIDRYGTRMYIKWNGWNYKYSTNPNSTDRYYHDFMASIADEVRVGFEPASISFAGGDNQLIYNSILQTLDEIPLSHFCLQTKFYDSLTDSQLRELSSHFQGLQIPYPDFPRGDPPSPTLTSPSVPTNPPLPTNTPFIQPTSPPGEPTYTPIPPTLAPPYEVITTPTLASTSWFQSLFTPPNPTPTIGYTNIPVTKRSAFDVKYLVCSTEATPNKMIRGVAQLPRTLFTMATALDANVELAINRLWQDLRMKTKL